MSISDLKVGISGGSIAGCSAARAFLEAGCDVEVFEWSSGGHEDRGSGIAIPIPLRDTLIARGYLPADYPNQPMAQRHWQYADGTDRGRTLWTQPTPATTNNWGVLWKALRSNVPDAIYRDGVHLVDFADSPSGVEARFSDGETRHFDVLVGADGYRSVVHRTLHPDVQPDFAGYVLWRGNYPEEDLPDRSWIDELDVDNTWLTVPFEGGHGVLYMIPDTRPGKRRVNWAVYTSVPKELTLDGVKTVAPGGVTPEAFAWFEVHLARTFPPSIASIVRHTTREEMTIQPIFDSIVDTYRGHRTILIGDAGSITRPHTASGATKAMEDALAIADLLESESDVENFLSRYDELRCGAARAVSEIGVHIGDAQVVHTPDWPNMSHDDFKAWIAATMAGKKLYLYADNDQPKQAAG